MEEGRKQNDQGSMSKEMKRLVVGVARDLTNPALPANQLKRPVYRQCLNCCKRYRSTVNILCDSGFCSEACQHAFWGS